MHGCKASDGNSEEAAINQSKRGTTRREVTRDDDRLVNERWRQRAKETRERERARKRVNGSHSLARCNEHSQPPRRSSMAPHLHINGTFPRSCSFA